MLLKKGFVIPLWGIFAAASASQSGPFYVGEKSNGDDSLQGFDRPLEVTDSSFFSEWTMTTEISLQDSAEVESFVASTLQPVTVVETMETMNPSDADSEITTQEPRSSIASDLPETPTASAQESPEITSSTTESIVASSSTSKPVTTSTSARPKLTTSPTLRTSKPMLLTVKNINAPDQEDGQTKLVKKSPLRVPIKSSTTPQSALAEVVSLGNQTVATIAPPPALTTSFYSSIPTTTSSLAKNTSSSPVWTSTPAPEPANHARSEIMTSSSPISTHVTWGNNASSAMPATNSRRIYSSYSYGGYAPCRKRYHVDYTNDIENGQSIPLILTCYGEILRVSCIPGVIQSFQAYYDRGHIYLNEDNSFAISKRSSFLVRPYLSAVDMEELQDAFEFTSISQVYVSWYKFPVASVGPIGEPITDPCFIELTAKLHALDSMKQLHPQYLSEMSNRLGMDMKPALRQMRSELVQSRGDNRKKAINANSLAVSMGLMEFLMKHPDAVLRGYYGCAHEAFKTFYVPKRTKYLALAYILSDSYIH